MSVGGTHLPRDRYAGVLYFLAALFVLRIAGQAVQRWFPVAWLPPFDDFQGSALPYGWLLAVQLLILALMLRAAWRVAQGRQPPSGGAARVLGWFGGIYMAGSLLRIAVGLVDADAGAWFTAWIPAFFHLVLAGFVLALASYHRVGSGAAA